MKLKAIYLKPIYLQDYDSSQDNKQVNILNLGWKTGLSNEVPLIRPTTIYMTY